MADSEIDMEHVLCGVCQPPVYLCGTPREEAELEVVVPLSTPHEGTPCAVCHEDAVLTCLFCGTRIRTRPSSPIAEPAEEPNLLLIGFGWAAVAFGVVVLAVQLIQKWSGA